MEQLSQSWEGLVYLTYPERSKTIQRSDPLALSCCQGCAPRAGST